MPTACPLIAPGNAPPAVHVTPPSVEYALTVVLELTATKWVAIGVAVPVPEPIPVATKYVPTRLDTAPMLVNTVLPSDVITYDLPMTNAPAVSTVVNLPAAMLVQSEVLGNANKF